MSTAREIANEIQRLIGDAAGAGVQVLTEDALLDTVNRAFRLFFTKFSWEQFLRWDEVTLDGTTGLITTEAWEEVKNFEDFLSIHPEGKKFQVPKLGRRTNPFTITGTRVRAFTSLTPSHDDFTTKRLQFWPKAATDTLHVHVRVDPSPFLWADEIALDHDLMVAAGAWLTLIGEDLNPSAAEGQRLFMDERFSAITAALARMPIEMGESTSTVPTDWFVNP